MQSKSPKKKQKNETKQKNMATFLPLEAVREACALGLPMATFSLFNCLPSLWVSGSKFPLFLSDQSCWIRVP